MSIILDLRFKPQTGFLYTNLEDLNIFEVCGNFISLTFEIRRS